MKPVPTYPPGSRTMPRGRLYQPAERITGVVETGDRRGRAIGFPTANVRMGRRHAAVPDGVYAAVVGRATGAAAHAAVSIGRRPTFYADGERLCEAHLLDFDGDLYGQELAVDLVWYLRHQTRFETVDALVEQLRRDVGTARFLLEWSDAIPR